MQYGFIERLREVVDHVGGQKELERLSGVDQTTISAWLKRAKNPKFQTVEKIADATGFCAEWLYLGRGPKRAEDAALVPMSLSAKLPDGDPRRVVKLMLIIDENPVPLAAAFTLGEKAGDTRISTRVRVDSYTNARVVAELSDGSLHMATRFVKASGGCSAPMVKSMD